MGTVELNKREKQLLDELNDRFACLTCRGVHYPRCWMTKTREKLVSDGVLQEVMCVVVDEVNVSLRVC